MKSIILVETDEKNDCHQDLIFKVAGLVERTFDTYYFAIAIEPYETYQDIRNCVSGFVNHWIDQVQSIQVGQTKYLPIDISDQYTGCLKVKIVGDELELTYGCSRREGWSIDILNPTDYFDDVKDFEQTEPCTVRIRKLDFIGSVRAQVSKLRNQSLN